MENDKNLVANFSIEELESRLEMKPWVVKVCPGEQCV
ncbi:hypothetical protein Flavo103_25090 [Flavobacterium collinsii]|jgi:hypothetical protein|nr:hypothetical protein Flavo103_25090 [Flavobacterium collinsii]